MAFTEQNKADAYLFFVLAFNAAPGTVYGGQIVQAYESGMTTADIVAEYVTKDAFKAIYPDSQTNAEFAAALVNNVASANNPAAAKTAAIADIEKALADGWTKAQVITQIIGNLANKTVADAEWGVTVAQLNNKIAVAKELTEGSNALTTTDATLLQGPLALVTEDPATVQTALNAAGDLAVKLTNLAAAIKAKDDYEKTIVDADGEVTTAAAIKVAAANKIAASVADNGAGVTDYSTQVTGLTGAALKAKQAEIKQVLVSDKEVLSAELASLQAQVKAVDGLQAAINARQSTKAALEAATKDLEAKTKAVSTAINTANADKDATVAEEKAKMFVLSSGTVELDDGSNTLLINADLKLEDGVTEAKYPGITAVLNALKAEAASTAVVGDANTGLTKVAADAEAVFDAGGKFESSKALADAFDLAKEDLVTAEKAIANYDAALAKLSEADSIDAQNASLDQAITDAKDAFTDAGLKEPVEVDQLVVTATEGADIFLPDADTAAAQIVNFGLQGNDVIFVGKDYQLSADLAKGDDSVLEVFFKTNGVNTDVYIEQQKFSSNINGAADGIAKEIVKITLNGLTAEDLTFDDGFITLA